MVKIRAVPNSKSGSININAATLRKANMRIGDEIDLIDSRPGEIIIRIIL